MPLKVIVKKVLVGVFALVVAVLLFVCRRYFSVPVEKPDEESDEEHVDKHVDKPVVEPQPDIEVESMETKLENETTEKNKLLHELNFERDEHRKSRDQLQQKIDTQT